jgi:hypothetical protein
MSVHNFGQPVRMTESGNVCAPGRRMFGFFVSSTGSGTLEIRDGDRSITGTVRPTVGWYSFPAACIDRLSVTINGELDVTFFLAP